MTFDTIKKVTEMSHIIAYIQAHPYAAGIVTMWGVSAFVSSVHNMIAPTDKSGNAYRMVYAALQSIAANVDKVPFKFQSK